MESITNYLKGIIVLGVILFFTDSYSQTQQWVQRYNGAGNSYDGYEATTRDDNGNIYVTGSTVSEGHSDYLVIKYNSAGVEQWTKTYNGPGNADDFAYDIAVDASGNVYVTGGSIATDYDFATIKYNSAGTVQWIQKYNGTGNMGDFARYLAVDASGNVYVGGTSPGNGSNSDYAVVKYNSAGAQQWVQRYNGTGNDFDNLRSLKIDAAANVYVTGYSIDTGGSFSDAATIKYNSAGLVQWTARYNGPGNQGDEGTDLGVDASGNVFVTGSSNGLGTDKDFIFIKYNSVGTEQWVQRYNGTGNSEDEGYRIAVDASGNSVSTGFTTTTSGKRLLTIKYNNAGAERWSKVYDGPGDYNRGFTIALDNGGNVYVGGETIVTGIYTDCILLKYSSNGIQQFVQTYDGPAAKYDVTYDIAVDPSGAAIYTAGYSDGNGTQSDGLVIKYSQLTGVQNTINEIPETFSLSQNYPNPFNPSTKIQFNLPESGNVKLEVFDITGRMVRTLVNSSFNAGTHSVNFNAGNISAGVYYYRISYNGLSEVRKMVLIK